MAHGEQVVMYVLCESCVCVCEFKIAMIKEQHYHPKYDEPDEAKKIIGNE
jgi:hypothetical protein